MTNVTFFNMVGIAATAAVISYSAVGEAIPHKAYSYKSETSIQQYSGQYDYYTLCSNDSTPISKQIEIIHDFSAIVLNNIQDIDPDFSLVVDENFWDLV